MKTPLTKLSRWKAFESLLRLGQLKYEGKTNASGRYEFKQLPPGKYKITSDIPKSSRNNWETEVTVEDRSCSQIEFWNNVEGSINGQKFR